MAQFSNIDTKIELPNNLTKRVKTPLSFQALLAQVSTLAQAKGLAEPVSIHYIDLDGESVVIEDDTDLEMAYTCALTNDKRIKFCVVEPKQADVKMV